MDEIKFSCGTCSLNELCLPHGLEGSDLEKLDSIIKHQPPLQPGQHLFRSGDAGQSLYAVRSGSLKTYCTTKNGDEQVLGFTLPGEIVGLDGMSNGQYASNSVALETSSVCQLPFNQLDELCSEIPSLHRQMMRVVGKEVSADHAMLLLLGKRSADERLAAFLLSLSARYKARGLSATEFNLPMSRQDIGNYLGLAIETVSRLFAHFQDQKLLRVNRRQVTLIDIARLEEMFEGCTKVSSATGS
ncbi:MAG: fumarate/nitrate reduction transcriptional regulator Fnr [Gammaproteobacteria bacterium]|nr:fumarate/nitrate reduction transcriptional regulator Fnr [Gammaproteobacteria bacterium]